MIIGGALVYKEMLTYANKLLLIEIDSTNKKADVYFPKFNRDEYDKKVISEHTDVNSGLNYKHLAYTKKKKN